MCGGEDNIARLRVGVETANGLADRAVPIMRGVVGQIAICLLDDCYLTHCGRRM
jgi:hypothetical protein